MIFKSKLSALLRQSGIKDKKLGKKFSETKLSSIVSFSSSSNNLKVDLEKLEVPSRYDDVPISEKSYFDFVWENREKHFNKIAMVSCISLYFWSI